MPSEALLISWMYIFTCLSRWNKFAAPFPICAKWSQVAAVWRHLSLLYIHIQTIQYIWFCSTSDEDNNVRMFGGSNEGGPIASRVIILTLQGHLSVSKFKMMMRHCEDSFKILTASGKWLHHALQQFSDCLFALLVFQPSLSTATFLLPV